MKKISNGKGTNVVLLEHDVAEAFPTEDAVNRALRGIIETSRAARRTGGLTDRSPKTRSSAPRSAAARVPDRVFVSRNKAKNWLNAEC